MKVRITKLYFDKELNRYVQPNEVLNVTKERSLKLIEAHVGKAEPTRRKTEVEK